MISKIKFHYTIGKQHWMQQDRDKSDAEYSTGYLDTESIASQRRQKSEKDVESLNREIIDFIRKLCTQLENTLY